MKSSYNKELKDHEMESSAPQSPLKGKKDRSSSGTSLHKYVHRKRTETMKTTASNISGSSNMHQSISRVKQSKNQIYKSTIW